MKKLKLCLVVLVAVLAVGFGSRAAFAQSVPGAQNGNLLVNNSSPFDTNSADWTGSAAVVPNANVFARFSVPNTGWYESFLWCDSPSPALAIPQALSFNSFFAANPFTAPNPSTGVYGDYLAGGNYLTFPGPYCKYSTAGVHWMTMAALECSDSQGTQGCTAYTASDPITVGSGVVATTSAPSIAVSPSNFNLGITEGTYPSTITPNQVVSFTPSSGASGQAVAWTASPSASWIAINPSGTGPVTVILEPTAWYMIPGTYTGTITFSFPGTGAAPQMVTVNLTIGYPTAAAATASPSSLSFTVPQGSNPTPQIVTFKNLSTNAALATSCSSSGSGGSSCWIAPQNFSSALILDQATGLLDAPETVTVTTAGMALGNYSGSMTVSGSASGLPITIPVSLAVTAAQSPATVSATSSTPSTTTQPILSIDGSTFSLGQAWVLGLISNIDNTPFSFCVSQNGGSTSCAPSFGSTNSAGNWALSGNFSNATATAGSWAEWVQFPSGVTSNIISFTVGNPNSGNGGGSPATGNITINQATISPATQIAGQSFSVTYNWFGGPTSLPQTVFTHVVDANGNILINGDNVGNNAPPEPTNQWNGTTSYTRPIMIPTNLPAGTYRIMAGLYDYGVGSDNTTGRMVLTPGSGVTVDNQLRYKIGQITVTTGTSSSGSASNLSSYAQLSINGSTAPNRSFTVGQPWTLSLSTNNTFASTPFSLCYQNGPTGGSLGAVSCAPSFSTTDANGNWTASGTFAGSSVGSDQEWVTFPSSNNFSSNQLPFTVTGLNGSTGGNGTAAPTVTISAGQASVPAGQTTVITWSSANATSCMASGPAPLFEGVLSANGSTLSSPIAGTYTYVITCTSSGGASATASTTVTVMPFGASTSTAAIAPSAPQSFTATPGDGQVALSWSAPANLGSPTVTGYLIDDKPSASYAYALAAGPLASSATSTVITGLTNGTSYDFEVFALNSLTSAAAAQTGIVPTSTPVATFSPLAAALQTQLNQLISSLTSLLQTAVSQGLVTQSEANSILSSLSGSGSALQ